MCFVQQTIKDLFEQPSGLKALAEQKRQKMEADEKEKVESEETEQESEVESGKRPSGGKTEILAMFEQVNLLDRFSKLRCVLFLKMCSGILVSYFKLGCILLLKMYIGIFV